MEDEARLVLVDGGETIGGLKAKPGGAPASTASFLEVASGPATMSSSLRSDCTTRCVQGSTRLGIASARLGRAYENVNMAW